MGGLGFIHLGFLAAGAAVAVPILIHLLFRQRARRVEIGTLYFLRVVLRDQARRRRIRRWILLALRVAGVLLLALLFARPYRKAPETMGSEREAVLLIDRSASMAAGTAGASPFDKAQRQAAELIRGLPDGSAVRLAYFDAEGVVPAPTAQIDPAIHPGLAGTDLHQSAWLGARYRGRVTTVEAPGVSLDRPSEMRSWLATCGRLPAGRGRRADRCRPPFDDQPGRRGRRRRTDKPP